MTSAEGRTAAVIGGGPGGLAAAEVLADAGFDVAVYEQMPTVGRKLLMAGRGGLNLTHGEDIEAFLGRYGACHGLLPELVRKFPPAALRAWAEGLGQETFEGTSGRIFPKAMKASPLLRAWLARLTARGVTFRTRHRWLGWNADHSMVVQDANGTITRLEPSVAVLAMGGASWPRLGSDGAWVAPLQAAGVAVLPLKAANAGIRIAWSDVFRQRFEGEPLKRLALTCDGETKLGEAVVTRDGLEGGSVYALGRRIRSRLDSDGVAHVSIDVRPSFSLSELTAKLAVPRKKQSTATFLRKVAGMAPIAIGLAREGNNGALPVDPAQLAALIKAIPLKVVDMGDLTRAISTAGGVSFDALDENLMLRGRPGVFVAGEMLDWEAPTGGYLLQATFATARRAASGAVEWHGRQQSNLL